MGDSTDKGMFLYNFDVCVLQKKILNLEFKWIGVKVPHYMLDKYLVHRIMIVYKLTFVIIFLFKHVFLKHWLEALKTRFVSPLIQKNF